jgi:hypothetical protein
VAAEGDHCAGRSPAQWGSEDLSTACLRRSSCFPAEPCPIERYWRIRQGKAVGARLFEALKIFLSATKTEERVYADERKGAPSGRNRAKCVFLLVSRDFIPGW